MVTPSARADPPRRAFAKVGQVLRGKWQLDALLGAGGMATVYAATHRNGKRGALKILHPELAADRNARTRFLQEGYAANKVDHPGAVSVLDDDTDDDGLVFLVMELLDGESADARARSRPGHQLDLQEVVTIADGLLDVLAAAHAKGIVHRDIKPENLFLPRAGGVKVLDFGIARIREITTASAAKLTVNGALMGTPAFMPPEQALGSSNDVGPRSDLWAVGATMFTLLTGRYVHAEDTLNQILIAAVTKPAPRLADVLPGVPTALAAIVDRALAFDSNDRWPDARSMQEALRAIPSAQLAQTIAVRPMPPSPGLSTGASLSSERATRSMSVLRSRARLGAVIGIAVVIVGVTALALRAANKKGPVASGEIAPAINAETVSATVEATPPPPTVTFVPTASAPPAVPTASVRPPSNTGTSRHPVAPPVKSAEPLDPLEKF